MKKFVTWTTSVVFLFTLFASLFFLVQDGQSGEIWIQYKAYYKLIIDDAFPANQCSLELVKKVAVNSGTKQHRLDYHIGAASNVSDATQPDNTHPDHDTKEKTVEAETETLIVDECEEEEEPDEVDDTSGNNDDTSGNNDDTSGNNDDTSGNNDDTSGNNDDTSGNNDDSCSTCG